MSDTTSIQSVIRGDIEIRILRSLCIGAATCAVYSPKTFDLDEVNIAIIKAGEWDEFERIVEAAASCPVFAIEVYRAGVKLYPQN